MSTVRQIGHTRYAIVGGGVVGLSIAYGLLKQGCSVTVLDEGDTAFRASRGNFGLVWVQGKGLNQPAYARWSQRSARSWADFAAELSDQTGTNLSLQQNGGYSFYKNEQSLEEKAEKLARLSSHLDQYPFEVLGHNALRKEEPNIGPNVAGAILHHDDGHVNSLRLLKALAESVRALGGVIKISSRVTSIDAGPDLFALSIGSTEKVTADRVVLCAGLGSALLGPTLGFSAPIRAQRGQVLITEKIPPLINRPSDVIRQVDEGGVQIGASSEEVGPDDAETLAVTAALAQDGIDLFPALAGVNLVRSWAALRIMSPDGLPVYQQSRQYPGAFFVTCHSGITLAANHARLLPKWLEGHADAPDIAVFGEDRFDV